MDLSPDRFPIVCELARQDALGCEGANEFGACTIYRNAAVIAKLRRIGCAYKGFRAPIPRLSVKKARVGQQKQSKRKAKAAEKA